VSPYLSVIIPAYNEENRLPITLEQVFRFLGQQSYPYEVLVVENGSQDRTLEVAQEFSRHSPQLIVIHEDGRGKGLAVRRGMLEAHGEYRFMCDADLSMPVDQINRFLPPLLTDFDVAIGSREAPGAIRYNEPFHRHLGGRIINQMIRVLALPGLQDTQCGFKCFHKPAAEELFRRMTLTGWSFDIEIIYLARLLDYRLVEVAIPWYFNPASKLNLMQDALKMMADILTIRRKARQGFYQSDFAHKENNSH
jgi:dolichyl-phosphate beta-glucosyltransferase